jgi:flagellar biosynthesis protein
MMKDRGARQAPLGVRPRNRALSDDDTTARGAEGRRTVAVALAESGDGTDAPARIVATGRGAVAEQILAIAFAAGVKVREDADLAEVLAAIEVDAEIPVAAFAAVAEILAYVYRANGRTAERPAEEGAMP